MQHHLLTCWFEGLEDLILGAIHDSIEQQICEEVSHSDELSPSAGRRFDRTSGVLVTFLLVPEEHEGRDTDSDEYDDEVLIWSEFAAVEDDVHEHDGDEFARFGEDHCWVRYVRESRETKGRSGGDDDRALEILPQESFSVSFSGSQGDPMFDKFLRFGFVLVLVLLVVFPLMGMGRSVRVRAVLKGLWFVLVVEVQRGDEADCLFERMFRVFPNEEVYESGYATE